MKVNVKFFALGRELVGDTDLEIELDEEKSVQSLIELLKSKHPKLKELKSFLVAVNMEYAGMQHPLKDGDEVAIIPPVSGG
jgi:molybdopterin converting factor subunit 1